MSATPDFFTKLRQEFNHELIISLKDKNNWRPQKEQDTYLFTDPLQSISKSDVNFDELKSILLDNFGRKLIDWKRIDNDSHFHHVFRYAPLTKPA